MFCGYCGTQVPEGMRFCPGCGNAADQQPTAQSPVQTAVVGGAQSEPSREVVIEHLTYAAEMEKTVYAYRQLGNRLQNKINSLGHSKNIRTVPNQVVWTYGVVLIVAVIFLLILFFSLSRYGTIAQVIMIFIMVAIFPSLFKVGVKFFASKNARDVRNGQIVLDEQRVAREKFQITQLQQQQQDIKRRLNESDALLQRVYAVNIINPSYRNMKAVTTILEYYQTGMCTQLGGPFGAYSKYSLESKLGDIDTKLEIVHRDLEQIKYSHRKLHDALSTTNALLDRICDQNEDLLATNRQIAENTELIAYNTNAIRTNTAVSAYVDVMTYSRQDEPWHP